MIFPSTVQLPESKVNVENPITSLGEYVIVPVLFEDKVKVGLFVSVGIVVDNAKSGGVVSISKSGIVNIPSFPASSVTFTHCPVYVPSDNVVNVMRQQLARVPKHN